MKKNLLPILAICILAMASCNNTESNITKVGFLDFIQDPTIDLAKQGFYQAMSDNGYSEEKKTVEYIYSNAQGDIPTLNQACDRILSEDVDLMATNVTLSTITASKRICAPAQKVMTTLPVVTFTKHNLRASLLNEWLTKD